MAQTRPIAILGAGMAGATVARRLTEAGLPVRVFDKGRGVGGRMATRRAEDDLHFDHGAQFMRARGTAFAARLDDWERRGIVAPWAGEGRRVGVPGMTAPVRDLLTGLAVALGTTILRIARDSGGWHLTDSAGARYGPFAAVAVTFPSPQTLALLDASGLALPGVERATYAPCWSLMLAAEADAGPALAEPGEGAIGLVAVESSKPGRAPGGRFVVHATPDWSREHLEAAREAIAERMREALSAHLGHRLAPTHVAAHRWRYAQVESTAGQPCLYDSSLHLGAAGDWCLGPRIEAAHDSGLALAERLLADPGALA